MNLNSLVEFHAKKNTWLSINVHEMYFNEFHAHGVNWEPCILVNFFLCVHLKIGVHGENNKPRKKKCV